jgi:acetyltransferase-like isoleucine patch superfamily enzyme
MPGFIVGISRCLKAISAFFGDGAGACVLSKSARPGAHSTIGYRVVHGWPVGSIEIGEDAQIGLDSLVTTTEHNYHHQLTTHVKWVVIDTGVWIGAAVTVAGPSDAASSAWRVCALTLRKLV